MFSKKKTYLLSIPGIGSITAKEIQDFLIEHNINAKIIRYPIDIKELE